MGIEQRFQLGTVVAFPPNHCDPCQARAICTTAAIGNGRTVTIGKDEHLQQRLRKQIATPIGRERLRQRVDVEHALAHIGQRQGRRARYRGTRNNNFDLRRAASIQNLETAQRAAAA
jgi:hypothetical protein